MTAAKSWQVLVANLKRHEDLLVVKNGQSYEHLVKVGRETQLLLALAIEEGKFESADALIKEKLT